MLAAQTLAAAIVLAIPCPPAAVLLFIAGMILLSAGL
jgi:hypothetical protein